VRDARARDEKLRLLHQTLTAAVEDLTTSEGWMRMLTVASRFHRYSPANVLLIAAQRPDATYVAGIRTWNAMGRSVRRGEKGIAILAPRLSRRGSLEGETQAGDPDHRAAIERPVEDPGQAAERVLRGFLVVHVFDVAQTEGEPLPAVEPRLLEGDAGAELWRDLAALVASDGYSLERGPCGGANGWTRFDTRTVRVREDVSQVQACKTLAHEIAHIRAEHGTRFLGSDGRVTCRQIAEVEAESIAILVLSAQGMSTEEYTVPHAASWASGDVQVVKDSMARCVQTAHVILEGLDVAHEGEFRAAPENHPVRRSVVEPSGLGMVEAQRDHQWLRLQ
jgi:hypothetical protein